jgi:hypothetical protein
MACGCSKRNGVTTSGTPAGTYRVIVSGRQVYESADQKAADTVAERFANATVLPPGREA